eukprot:TRINITY_DN7697_c0_g2_i3.p1 TRINITY_DN7697_c0_g2~~TRINITY_DN7697_c0_g2_i3.p1  ORF type:complete len:262 (+),score=66.21 TRINITY_DN7697_c0_g2_i3:54-788(+)
MRVLLLCALLVCTTGEMLMEISFSLGPKQNYSGYSSAEPVSQMLQSSDLKWLRYFVPVISGQPRDAAQHVAHFMFPDYEAWTRFQQDHHYIFRHLFDHFWPVSKRNLYNIVSDELYHKQKRTEGNVGGFIWQFHYAVAEGKEQLLANHIASASPAFAQDLKNNEGFFERYECEDKSLGSEFPFMVAYDFQDFPSMYKSMRGQHYLAYFNGMKKYLSNYAVTIMAPGTGDGLFWIGLGADPSDEE